MAVPLHGNPALRGSVRLLRLLPLPVPGGVRRGQPAPGPDAGHGEHGGAHHLLADGGARRALREGGQEQHGGADGGAHPADGAGLPRHQGLRVLAQVPRGHAARQALQLPGAPASRGADVLHHLLPLHRPARVPRHHRHGRSGVDGHPGDHPEELRPQQLHRRRAGQHVLAPRGPGVDLPLSDAVSRLGAHPHGRRQRDTLGRAQHAGAPRHGPVLARVGRAPGLHLHHGDHRPHAPAHLRVAAGARHRHREGHPGAAVLHAPHRPQGRQPPGHGRVAALRADHDHGPHGGLRHAVPGLEPSWLARERPEGSQLPGGPGRREARRLARPEAAGFAPVTGFPFTASSRGAEGLFPGAAWRFGLPRRVLESHLDADRERGVGLHLPHRGRAVVLEQEAGGERQRLGQPRRELGLAVDEQARIAEHVGHRLRLFREDDVLGEAIGQREPHPGAAQVHIGQVLADGVVLEARLPQEAERQVRAQGGHPSVGLLLVPPEDAGSRLAQASQFHAPDVVRLRARQQVPAHHLGEAAVSAHLHPRPQRHHLGALGLRLRG
ncbi:putative DNA-invertase [Stigmatella aurantiaca DW4/3-1]|uniref:Putative DNA-invertase n=1 Tax=Stigmatella aurantiaca (strain DW4/3-1) TaxID=378806 RepID=Q08R74_STIAD|nr:putative DNA-invertase [Stigmatella aurantiaca DW4/3-1]